MNEPMKHLIGACQARRAQETEAWERLRDFRQDLYDDLGYRQGSLFE
jgi:hypothetical protein